MEKLKDFYGKELVYIHTTLINGVIHHDTKTVKVYDPTDYKKRIAPIKGCDIVIGDNSTNSKYIYSIGGIQHSASVTTYTMIERISIFTYCYLSESEEVIKLHLQEVMKLLNEFYVTYSKKLNHVKMLLENKELWN